MKNHSLSHLILLLFTITGPFIMAQPPHLERQVISIGGSCRSNDNIDLCDNAGEVAVTTLVSSQGSLYQGFEQGDLSVIIATHEEKPISQLSINPNPAHNKIIIRSQDTGINISEIALYDLMGRPYPLEAEGEVSNFEFVIDVNMLPSGIYMIAQKLQTNKMIIQKFIKI